MGKKGLEAGSSAVASEMKDLKDSALAGVNEHLQSLGIELDADSLDKLKQCMPSDDKDWKEKCKKSMNELKKKAIEAGSKKLVELANTGLKMAQDFAGDELKKALDAGG